jgi:hypothetical protein
LGMGPLASLPLHMEAFGRGSFIKVAVTGTLIASQAFWLRAQVYGLKKSDF